MRWLAPGRAIKICASGIAAYALGLIIILPATLIDARMDHATRGIIRLAETRGSVWSGSGQLEIREKGRRIGSAHNLTWRFQPSSLLRGQLGFAIELGSEGRLVPLTVGFSRIELTNADISLPASVLGLIEPRIAPLQPDGELSLHIPRLVIGRNLIQGNGVLQWRNAGSALTTVSPLGDYELNFTANDGTVSTTMRTLQGPLQIDGQGTWTATASAFSGTARVPASLQQQLTPLLRLFTVERSPGNFEIQIK